MNRNLIISGFQGVGKSTYAKSHLNCLDLESSNFDKSNPRWYIDYCKTALDLLSQGYTVFVSSHKEVRDYLLRQTPFYVMICPTKDIKGYWIGDLMRRYQADPSVKNYRAWKSAAFDFDSYINEISEDKYLLTYWINDPMHMHLDNDMMSDIVKLVNENLKK